MAGGKIVKAKIVSNRKAGEDHFFMELEHDFLSERSRPGQFVNVKVKDEGTDPLLRIPLGVSRITDKGISLLYKVVGPATRELSRKKAGESLDVLGPLGRAFDVDEQRKGEKKDVLLVAGGHGVAPLLALAEQLRGKKTSVTVLVGAATAKHVVLVKELKKAGCRVKVATEDGSLGEKGYVSCLFSESIHQMNSKDRPEVIYACGPRPMLAVVAREAEKAGIGAQVSMDAYMACGIGACLGCAVKTKTGYQMVCKDGPVFDSADIEWEETPGIC